MRILLIHQYFLESDDPGGSRFNEMARIWTENGHSVTVLAGMIHANKTEKRPEYKGKYFLYKKDGKVGVWRCHVPESYNKNFHGRFKGYLAFMFSTIWAGLFKIKGKYDLILATSPPLFVGISAYTLSRVKRIPFVFEVRDLWPESAIDSGVVKNKYVIKLAYCLERFIYRKSSLINVLTPGFDRHLVEKKNINGNKIIQIPNAADFHFSDQLKNNFDRTSFRIEEGKNDNFVVTYVGAHGLANHLIQLIEAAELLKDTNVLFQLIGDGMQKKMLFEEVQKRRLNNVRFVDGVPKKEVFKYIIASELGISVLKKADIFKTIYSNKTFDYMSCKKPVLMVIDGVSRELIESAECGLYAEPENPNDIAGKIREYISNPQLLELHGQNGYRFAKKNFDRNVLSIQYMKHLQQL